MIRRDAIRPEFVEYVPSLLEEGVVYISIPFATASHRCCCGCGSEVVTPLSPTDWRLIFDGDTISLDPSIGNWSLPCQSHYWIERNSVRWAPRWSRAEIDEGRAHDRLAKTQYFEPKPPTAPGTVTSTDQSEADKSGPTLWMRLKQWWRG
jgi:hypothetical protein